MVPCKNLSRRGGWLLYRCVRLNQLEKKYPLSHFCFRYDIFAINIGATMIGYVYGHSESVINSTFLFFITHPCTRPGAQLQSRSRPQSRHPGWYPRWSAPLRLARRYSRPQAHVYAHVSRNLYQHRALTVADGVELILMIIATFGQTVSGSGHAVNIIGVLVVWRFLVCQ